jgi:hypothetical protein
MIPFILYQNLLANDRIMKPERKFIQVLKQESMHVRKE